MTDLFSTMSELPSTQCQLCRNKCFAIDIHPEQVFLTLFLIVFSGCRSTLTLDHHLMYIRYASFLGNYVSASNAVNWRFFTVDVFAKHRAQKKSLCAQKYFTVLKNYFKWKKQTRKFNLLSLLHVFWVSEVLVSF